MLVLIISQAIVAKQPAVSQQDLNLQAIDVYLESKLKQYRIPGLAIAIVQGDRIIHSKGFGIADSENRPVNFMRSLRRLTRTFIHSNYR